MLRWIPCLLFASSAAAQGRGWVVGSSQGPDADFTELPAAIGAAADGDARDASH